MSETINSLLQDVNEKRPELQILDKLFNSEEELYAKTELNKPTLWGLYQTLENDVKECNLPKSHKILVNFRENVFKNSISLNRKGRSELIEALQSITSFEKQNEKHRDLLNPVNN